MTNYFGIHRHTTPGFLTHSVLLCLIPRFLRPYRSRGRAENEREYGGDDEECPSGNDGVDRAECWYRPSGDEVPDHTC